MRFAMISIWLAVAFPAMVAAEAVTFAAADGAVVHAEFQGDAQGPLILLFHQAGGNHHEYDPIAGRLNAVGYDTLAVDQRAGGRAYGFDNETAKAVSGDYAAAYADLEAAVAWAGGREVIVWGSSYSSSLVFVLAAAHPKQVRAVLAFSPGEYFRDKRLVRDAAARVRQPVFVSSASDAGEEAQAAAIAAVVAGPVVHLKAARAPHGSSSLREDANPKGQAEIWAAVMGFLGGV
jgi:pimeloyl-ACP methyl ester carboxylesterase